MTIQLWLDDGQLQHIAGRQPSTPYGVTLMQQWPMRYQGPLMTSASYRGCAAALANVLDRLNQRLAATVDQAIQQANQLLTSPEAVNFGDDFRGMAGITLTNAWHSAHDHGLTVQQAMSAYESEMIYTAKLFIEAHQREARGEKLA